MVREIGLGAETGCGGDGVVDCGWDWDRDGRENDSGVCGSWLGYDSVSGGCNQDTHAHH
jgi:hypothetical protein